MSRVRVKMCGVRSGEDLEAVVRSGADAVGFLVGQVHVSEDFISVDQAADLARSLPPFITPVVTTHLNDAGAILRMCEQVGAGVVQLHGTPKVSDLREVRKRAPASLRFMMAVHVVGEGVHPDVTPYLSMLDGVVVDTLDRDAGRVGGTGTVHDWTVTVTLRSALNLPVVLAGGLNPANVAEAVRTVQPYAVDVNSGVESADGSKSPRLCREFVRACWEGSGTGRGL